MAQAAENLGRMTIGEFDIYVESIPNGKDFELLDGAPMLMGNPTEAHEQIAMNIAGALKPRMDARSCRTYAGNMRIQASSDATGKDKFKPDVVVRCGPVSTNTYVLDPIVIVEVLSPSTMDRDRGIKLAFYKQLPTAQHIVLAYSDQMRVEHYVRTGTGWECNVLTHANAILEFEAVEFSMELTDVYRDVPFDRGFRPS